MIILTSYFFWGGELYAQAPMDPHASPNLKPKNLEKPPGSSGDIGVDEKIGDFLPKKTLFIDSDGKQVELGAFVGERPLILTPVYYDCPDLCNLTLNGLLRAINKDSSLTLGKDYDIISFSINPAEKDDLAFQKRKLYLGRVRNKTLEKWSFLTGDDNAIASLTDAIGFRYTQDQKDFLHTAVLVFISPSGKITRYLYGTSFRPQDFKLSLLEANEGKTGSFSDKVLLFCYGFDPVTKKYSLIAWRVMQFGSGLVVILLVIFLGVLWFREKQKTKNRRSDG